jgi:predicted dehydrogenase
MAQEKFLIIGLGLIGKQRLDACLSCGIAPENIYAFDINLSKLTFLNDPPYKGIIFIDDHETAMNAKVDGAIVAVPHDIATPIVNTLLNAGIRVLLEKPLGRNIHEAQELSSHSNAESLSIGFNYRFMPGIAKLKTALELGVLGDISTIRMELGHGGSPRDSESWKLDPVMAGGGVLLDPGIHLIDLLVYLFNATQENISIKGKTVWRGHWNTGIEESSNLIGYVGVTPFHIASSIVAWRTRFKIEVIGTERYLEISGRGRSDGPQTITEGPKWGWLNSTSQKSSESHDELAIKDESLDEETHAWIMRNPKVCSINQALEGMKIYARIMESPGEL